MIAQQLIQPWRLAVIATVLGKRASLEFTIDWKRLTCAEKNRCLLRDAVAETEQGVSGNPFYHKGHEGSPKA